MISVPGPDAGSYENVLDTLHMLGSKGVLDAFGLICMLSIAFFNFFGVTIGGELSAVHRTVLDALRTTIIWAVEVALGSLGYRTYGRSLTPHSWMQLLGFVLLILGNLLYNSVIRLPCFSYAKEGEEAPSPPQCQGPPPGSGVSLMP